MLKKGILAVFVLLLVFSIAACSGSNDTTNGQNNSEQGQNGQNNQNDQNKQVEPVEEVNQVPEINTDPVTLKFLGKNSMTQESFNEEIVKPVQEKYPHISFEFIQIKEDTAIDMRELAAAGVVPDLGFTNIKRQTHTAGTQMAVDLMPFMEKYGYDVNQLDPGLIEISKYYSQYAGSSYDLKGGELFHLPYTKVTNVTFYNKAIFDDFGIDYPEMGLTWEEGLELNRKITRVQDGITYRGFHENWHGNQYLQQEMTFVDPETNKVDFLTDDWINLANWYSDMYSIPDHPRETKWWGGFIKDQTVAVIPAALNQNKIVQLAEAEAAGFEYGIVNYPEWEVHPGVGPTVSNSDALFVGDTDNKDQAFLAMTHLIYDLELNKEKARIGVETVLQHPEIDKVFGENSTLKGKNLAEAARYFKKYADSEHIPFDGDGHDVWKKEVIIPILLEGADPVELLRAAQEKVQTQVNEELAEAAAAKAKAE